MALSSNNLKLWIGYLSHYYAKLGDKLRKKYIYGSNCVDMEKRLLMASWMLEELELYYNGCSCLEEEDVCNMIVVIRNLVK
jgi:hypothetical protein